MAGTIAARRGNTIGIAGVAAGTTIIPTKFLSWADGLTPRGTTAHAVLALDYLTDLKKRHGLNIVATSNSWGGGGYSRALLDAAVRAARAQILFIVAAGNGGADEIGDDNDELHRPRPADNEQRLRWCDFSAGVRNSARARAVSPARMARISRHRLSIGASTARAGASCSTSTGDAPCPTNHRPTAPSLLLPMPRRARPTHAQQMR